MFQPDSFGKVAVPTDVEFKYMLQELLTSKLNVSISEHQVLPHKSQNLRRN